MGACLTKKEGNMNKVMCVVVGTICVVASGMCCVNVSYADPHSVSLTVIRELGWDRITQEENVRRAEQKDDKGNPLPALTKDEVIQQFVDAEADRVVRNMRALKKEGEAYKLLPASDPIVKVE